MAHACRRDCRWWRLGAMFPKRGTSPLARPLAGAWGLAQLSSESIRTQLAGSLDTERGADENYWSGWNGWNALIYAELGRRQAVEVDGGAIVDATFVTSRTASRSRDPSAPPCRSCSSSAAPARKLRARVARRDCDPRPRERHWSGGRRVRADQQDGPGRDTGRRPNAVAHPTVRSTRPRPCWQRSRINV